MTVKITKSIKVGFFQKNRQRGFTLLEMAIVLAAIGLLLSVSLPAMGAIGAKGRDTKRIEDLNTIRQALEMYRNDKGYYPPSPCGHDCNGYYYSWRSTWNTLATELAPYITKLPVDPINTPNCGPWTITYPCYAYSYGNVWNDTHEPSYDLTARLESPDHPERCGVRDYKYWWNQRPWCQQFGGAYPNEIYEASPL